MQLPLVLYDTSYDTPMTHHVLPVKITPAVMSWKEVARKMGP
jgi:hypothetical protein